MEIVPDAGHGRPADDAEWGTARARRFLDLPTAPAAGDAAST